VYCTSVAQNRNTALRLSNISSVLSFPLYHCELPYDLTIYRIILLSITIYRILSRGSSLPEQEVEVQQKVSGCFRSLAGAQAFSRIRGYVSTLRKQGHLLLSALQATLGGHPLLPSFE
jgi:hypothetical protein